MLWPSHTEITTPTGAQYVLRYEEEHEDHAKWFKGHQGQWVPVTLYQAMLLNNIRDKRARKHALTLLEEEAQTELDLQPHID